MPFSNIGSSDPLRTVDENDGGIPLRTLPPVTSVREGNADSRGEFVTATTEVMVTMEQAKRGDEKQQYTGLPEGI